MPVGASFKIFYPSSVTISGITVCSILYNSVTTTLTGCSLDPTNSVIYITSGFNTAVNAGDSLAITFGMITNPNTEILPGTFGIQSFTDSSYTYKIDQDLTGLPPTFDCDYPCKICNIPTSKS